jgi:hypothetical protein
MLAFTNCDTINRYSQVDNSTGGGCCCCCCCYILAGITEAMVLQPGVPLLPAAWAALLAFMAQHTPPGAQPVLAAHNGFTFDFKMLAACLLRAQQQQQQQQGAGIPATYINSAGGCSSAAGTHSNGASSSSSSSAQLPCSCCELPQGMLTLDSFVLVRRLQLKQQAGLANLQQGMQHIWQHHAARMT